MAINPIPERTINFRISMAGERDPIGVATIDLPELSHMTDTVSGAGIAGEYESPTLGHLESMTATLNFRTITGNMFALQRPGAQDITARASMQVFDSGLGVTTTTAIRIEMRVMNKTATLGSLEPSALTDSSVELEVLALRVFVDDRERLEVDKAAFKFVVDGVDYLAKVRADLAL